MNIICVRRLRSRLNLFHLLLYYTVIILYAHHRLFSFGFYFFFSIFFTIYLYFYTYSNRRATTRPLLRLAPSGRKSTAQTKPFLIRRHRHLLSRARCTRNTARRWICNAMQNRVNISRTPAAAAAAAGYHFRVLECSVDRTPRLGVVSGRRWEML